MLETFQTDPLDGEQTIVWTGHGTVLSVRGVGPAIGDTWLYYLVEIHDDAGQVITAVVAANDPACQRAIDTIAFGRDCTWRIEHQRLPHIPSGRALTDLTPGVDTTAVLTELSDAPPSLAAHLDQVAAGDDR